MEKHSGVRSSTFSAVVWNLPQLYLESGGLHLLSLFDKCLCTSDGQCGVFPGACGWYVAVLLDTPDGKWGTSPGVYLSRGGCSAYMAILITCVDIIGVSQTCLLRPCGQICFLARRVCSDLGSFPPEPVLWLTANHLG